MVLLGLTVSWLGEPTGDEGDALIKRACFGDPEARRLVKNWALYRLTNGRSLPPLLAAYVAARLEQPESEAPRKGRPRADNHWRDYAIAEAVYDARMFTGLHLTRNRASQHPSACSVVADELPAFGVNMTEANVEKIWERLSGEVLHVRC